MVSLIDDEDRSASCLGDEPRDGTAANTDTKLLICDLFQKGRVLAQDGVTSGMGRFSFLSFVVLVAVLYGLPGYSQSSEGRIAGKVSDTLGALVPGAAVTITNQATNARRAATTSSDGSYSISLAPGIYSLTVTLQGFAEHTRRDLTLEAGTILTVDVILAVAPFAEQVTVTSLKREELVHDVPFSVAAPTEDVLRDRGAQKGQP